MFIVIQEITVKKENKYGASKRIEASQYSTTIGGITKIKNYHTDSSERFERPIKKAYKISIHKSYREDGKVKKIQKVITTADYYSLAEFSIYDCLIRGRIEDIAESFNISSDELYDMIFKKAEPLEKQIREEFEATEEYKAQEEKRKLLDKYQKAKSTFSKKYGVDSDEYDYCYNVFGELTNKDYLEEIKARKKQQEEYTNNAYEDFKRSYQYSSNSNYNNNSYGSYFNLKQSNHTEEEKQSLKSFYKVLAMKFHPDKNLDKDTTKEMQLINKLKEEWGI